MKNIFITSLAGSIITGCVTLINVNPSSSPSVSPSPSTSSTSIPSGSPAGSPIPSGSPSTSSTPIPSGSPAGSSTPNPTTTPDVSANGNLEGKLTIGPLCPVEPCNISDEQKRQAYEARKIQIFMPDGTTLVKEFIADYQTQIYKTELHAGRYMLNVTNAGIGPFQQKEVIIEANKTTVLNIDIDTGIR